MTAAVEQTVAHLRGLGLLGPEHAALLGLLQSCANDIDSCAELSTAKGATTRTLAGLLERLPQPEERETGAWERLEAEMQALGGGKGA